MITPHDQIGSKISNQQAEDLLEQDIRKAENALHRYCAVPLTENQQAALISFIFNCGAGAFQSQPCGKNSIEANMQ